MALFTPPFANLASRRFPTSDERLNGFLCGPLDQNLFNGMFHRIEAEMNAVIVGAGLTGTDADLTQLKQAIQAMIDAATGGGETENYLLISQARARLPIFPIIDSADGRMNCTSPSAGTVRIPGNVDWLHRGIFPMTTAETDFATSPSKTYHIRWSLADGYTLEDLTDVGYNPAALAETNSAFDTTYDNMLIARVVTNAGNVATITNLANLDDLFVNSMLTTGDVYLSGVNGANFLFTSALNWSRTPKNKSLHMVRAIGATGDDSDMQYTDTSVNRNSAAAVGAGTAAIPCTRYGLSCVVMRDGASSLTVNFDARA